MNTFTPNPLLEMLMQREQFMEDIDAIVDEYAYIHDLNVDEAEDLVRMLSDAVVRNFPTKWQCFIKTSKQWTKNNFQKSKTIMPS